MNTFYFSIVVFRADWSFKLCPKPHLFLDFYPDKAKNSTENAF